MEQCATLLRTVIRHEYRTNVLLITVTSKVYFCVKFILLKYLSKGDKVKDLLFILNGYVISCPRSRSKDLSAKGHWNTSNALVNL